MAGDDVSEEGVELIFSDAVLEDFLDEDDPEEEAMRLDQPHRDVVEDDPNQGILNEVDVGSSLLSGSEGLLEEFDKLRQVELIHLAQVS